MLRYLNKITILLLLLTSYGCSKSEKLVITDDMYFVVKQKDFIEERAQFYLVRIVSFPSPIETGEFLWHKMQGSRLDKIPERMNKSSFSDETGLSFENVNLSYSKDISGNILFLDTQQELINEWSPEICIQSSTDISVFLNVDFEGCQKIYGIRKLGQVELSNQNIKELHNRTEVWRSGNIESELPIELGNWFFIILEYKNVPDYKKVIGFEIKENEESGLDYRWVNIKDVSDIDTPLNLYALDYSVGNSFAGQIAPNKYLIDADDNNLLNEIILEIKGNNYFLLITSSASESFKGSLCTTKKKGLNAFYGLWYQDCVTYLNF